MGPSDQQLLIACRRGDEAAWESLVLRYQRLIYTIARRAGLDSDRSAEVFQEVFTTLFEKLNDIVEPDKLHAWLVTTARRKTFRLIKKEKSWQPVTSDNDRDLPEEDLAGVVDDSPLPDELLLRLEEQHRVRTALSALDERCQKLLKFLFYEAEPPAYSVIAAALGTSEGSIGPTRARCLEKLVRLLDT